MRPVKTLTIAVAAVAAMLSAPVHADEFYEGKTITCVVPYSPGGGTDAFFRVIVPHLARLIPGQPDIVINNLTGAGGLKANNYASNEMPNDGSEMLCAPWLSIAQMTQSDGVRFDYTKMRVIGGESGINTAVVNKDIMIDGDRTTIGQGSQRLVLAGLSPTSSIDIRHRLGLDLLGVDYAYIPGYRGSAKQVPAFLSGEVSYIGMNYGTYASGMKGSLVDQGPGVLWLDFPRFDSEGNPVASAPLAEQGIPTLNDLYKEMHGEQPSGEIWEAYKTHTALTSMGLSIWLPEGASDEAVAALRAGWEALPSDPEFIAAHEQAFGKPVNFVTYEQALAAQSSVGSVEPEMVKFFQDYIEKGAQ